MARAIQTITDLRERAARRASWTLGSSLAFGSGTVLGNRETFSVAHDVPTRLPPPLPAACFSPARFLESGRRGVETYLLQPTSTGRQKVGSWC
jgi:hypothetical protein